MFMASFVTCLICRGISRRMRGFLVQHSELGELEDFLKKAQPWLGEQRALASCGVGLTFLGRTAVLHPSLQAEPLLTSHQPCYLVLMAVKH